MQRKRFVQLRNRQTLRELRSELTDAYRCTQLTFDEWIAFLKGMRLCRLQKCVLFSSRQRAHRRRWTERTARDSDVSGPRYRVPVFHNVFQAHNVDHPQIFSLRAGSNIKACSRTGDTCYLRDASIKEEPFHGDVGRRTLAG